MIPAVVELFGLVIGSFLNVWATGMFRRRSTLPFRAFLARPGVLPLFLGRSSRALTCG